LPTTTPKTGQECSLYLTAILGLVCEIDYCFALRYFADRQVSGSPQILSRVLFSSRVIVQIKAIDAVRAPLCGIEKP
jgi:hypothetical protein